MAIQADISEQCEPNCRDCARGREQDETRAAEHGYKPTVHVEALAAIFGKAVSHDSVCQLWDARTYEDIMSGRKDDANKNALRGEIVDLCAAIASAALRRVPTGDLATRGISQALESCPDDGELDAFLRPIFEESGIGARYVSDRSETLKARGNL